jgi:hypothetical protein
MKNIKILLGSILFFFSTSYAQILINHTSTNLDLIPAEWIDKAKTDLRIAYGHTSHGSQLITGMQGLIDYKGDLYIFNEGGTDGALDLRDTPFVDANDLGNPDRTAWEQATRTYLDQNPGINGIIWSWCGQVGTATEEDIITYLNLMTGLENDYPDVKFVYMTGHLSGTGLDGNLHLRNEQIRNFCNSNSKILYDFADIETYNPDGMYFGDKIPTDNCDYDADGDEIRESNWAIEWQNTHPGEWYDCPSAHSQPLNANLKAYAAWYLWARLAGWSGEITLLSVNNQPVKDFYLLQNYPNPFNSSTQIRFVLNKKSYVKIEIYSSHGEKVAILLDKSISAGEHEIDFSGQNLSTGIYFYWMRTGGSPYETDKFEDVKKMILMK